MTINKMKLLFIFLLGFLSLTLSLLTQHQRILTSTVKKKLSFALSHNVIGHNHDHKHTHDHNHYQDNSLSATSTEQLNLKSLLSRPRNVVMIIGTLFFIPALLNRKLKRFDIISYVVVTVFLSTYDKLRLMTKDWIGKVKNFKENVIKHTTPITKNYFFKNENAADRVTLLGVWINILLSIIKFAGGIAFNSAVLVADAGHSLSDLLSDFITLWAVQIARLPADEDHPYGHGKFESIGSLFLSLTLVATGVSIGAWSYEKMRDILTLQKLASGAAAQGGVVAAVQLPSWPAMILALVSITSKEWLYRVTRRVGVLLNSQIVIANAWHHRSDAFSSVLSLFSIALAIYLPGFLVVDPAAGILIAGMISISGMEILFESIKSLSDTSDHGLADGIKNVTESVDGVLGVRNIRTRSVGSNSLIDLTILTDTQLSASSAQTLSDRVRWKLLDSYPEVVDAIVRTHSSGTPCPLLSSQNTKLPLALENEIRQILSKSPSLQDISGIVDEIKRVTIYYINPVVVNAEIVVKLKKRLPSFDRVLTYSSMEDINNEITLALKTNLKELSHVSVLLDLSDSTVESATATTIASLSASPLPVLIKPV